MTKSSDKAETSHPTSFDEIADQFVEQIRQGQYPSVQHYVDKYPKHQAEIEDLFPTLAKLENFDPFVGGEPNSKSNSFSVPSQFGDYEIIGELGRGGMGIVFEAFNKKLRRRVALKVLPPDTPNQELVERFELEARAAGQLHHTNIVPVFDVGEFEGMHFYSMQFINGQGLDVILDEIRSLRRTKSKGGKDSGSSRYEPSAQSEVTTVLSTGRGTEALRSQTDSSKASVVSWSQIGDQDDGYFRRVAHVGIQVSKAMEYAHQQGVLHRDIKPANLLLDTEGVVWITDFGLAKDGDVGLTQSGDIVGTLRYMAPERFNGHSDARSDVYSLGLTLYELCTLKYAYDQSDRAELIKKLTTQSPVPPRRLRPEIPVDLETIIVKAISHDPARRYQTAHLMSQDLDRFLNDRPVLARRVTWWERTVRWTKRNPFPATVAGLIVLIGIILILGSMVFARMSSNHATALLKENARVNEEKSRTEDALAKLKRSNQSSKGHLYHAFVGQARASSLSGEQGQNYAALSSVQSAGNTVRELGLSEERSWRRYQQLAEVAIRAMANWDLKTLTSESVKEEMTTRFAVNFKSGLVAMIEKEGNIVVRKLDSNNRFTDEVVSRMKSPGQQAWNPLFSPCGRFLAAAYHHSYLPSERTLIVWDVKTGKPLFSTTDFLNGSGFCFTSDGARFAYCSMATKIVSIQLGEKPLEQFLNCAKRPTQIQFGPGDQLAVAYRNSSFIDLWDFKNGEKVLTSLEFPANVTAFDWRPDLSKIAVAMEAQIRVLKLAGDFRPEKTESEIQPSDEESTSGSPVDSGIRFDGHSNRVVRLFLHPSGNAVISTAWDGTTRLHSLEENRQVLRVDGMRINAGGFDAEGKYLPYSNKSTEIGIWSLPLDRPLVTRKFPGEKAWVHRSTFVPYHSHWMICPSWNQLLVWDHTTNQVVGEFDFGEVKDLIMVSSDSSPDKGVLYTSGDRGLQARKYRIGTVNRDISFASPVELVKTPTEQVAIDSTGQLIAVRSSARHYTLVNLKDGKTSQIGPHQNAAWVAFANQGNHLITTTWQGRGIKVWDTSNGELITDLKPEVSTTVVNVNDNDDRLYACSGDRLMVWKVKSWEPVIDRPRENPDGWPGQICFSPDGRWVCASYSRYQTQMMDASELNNVGILVAPYRNTIAGLRWSKDGRYLFVGDSNIGQVWNMEVTKKKLAELEIPWKPAITIAKQDLN